VPHQRRHPRYPGTLTVQVFRDGAPPAFGTIYEISAGGAFLEVTPIPPVGGTIAIEVRDGARRVRLPAEVRYYVSAIDGPRGLGGVGLLWKDLAGDSEALVNVLVERAAAGKPLRSDD
jgi:PilZ domain